MTDGCKLLERTDLILKIKKVVVAKKEYHDLLLLADEQENMIDKYLENGEMFILDDHGIKAECVITKEANDIYAIYIWVKNTNIIFYVSSYKSWV